MAWKFCPPCVSLPRLSLDCLTTLCVFSRCSKRSMKSYTCMYYTFRRDLETFLFHSVSGHQDTDWLCLLVGDVIQVPQLLLQLQCVCVWQKFCFKTIKISQRPNHEKGFGFTVSGGREFNRPVVVEKVIRGVCRGLGLVINVCCFTRINFPFVLSNRTVLSFVLRTSYPALILTLSASQCGKISKDN